MSNQLFANPNNWDTVELGDLISVIAGHGFKKSEYSNSGIKLLQIANVTFQEISWEETAYLPNEYIGQYPKLVLKPGDLVMALNRPILGRKVKFAILSQNDCPAILYQRVGKFIFKSKSISRDFLYVFMQTDYFYHELKSRLAGSDQPYINPTELVKIRVPVPPLNEQKQIAAIAQKADRLRRTRRYALQLGDTYLQSVFLEMFGDPIKNSKGFETFELEDLASVERGKFTPRPRNDPSYYGGSYPFIQTGDISNSVGRLNRWTQTLNEKGKKVSRSFPPGTVVIAIVGATIGATAILDIEVYCPDSVIGIQAFKERTTPEYIECLLRFWKPIFLAQAPETARANINLDTLRPLKIPLPPICEQQKFSRIVQHFERLCTQQREGDRQAEHLFQTLLHRAFRGELTSQEANDEPASVLLEQIGAEQAQAEAEAKTATQAMSDAAEYLGTKAKQQDTEPIQLTLPGIE